MLSKEKSYLKKALLGALSAVVLVVSVAVFSPATHAADDWPMFLRDPAHSALIRNSPDMPLELKWSFQTGDEIVGSPAVKGSTVYFGSYDDNLYAVDVESGQELWSFATGGDILSSPAVKNGVVYFGSKDGKLYALDADSGEELWAFETKGPVLSSPAVVGGTVFFGSKDTYIYALDAENGEKKWRIRLADYTKYSGIFSSPAYADGSIFITSKNGRIYSLDAESGAKNWEMKTKSAIYASPVVSRGVVYVASYDRYLYAFSAEHGKQIWKSRLKSWPYSSPTLGGARIFIGLKNGDINVHSRMRGAKISTLTLPGGINSSILSTREGLVIAGCEDGAIYAVDLESGEIVWQFMTGGGIKSTPALSGGRLFVGSRDGSLYAFGP